MQVNMNNPPESESQINKKNVSVYRQLFKPSSPLQITPLNIRNADRRFLMSANGTPTTAFTPFRNPLSARREIVGKISDIRDKDHIQDALNSVRNISDKVKMIDQIMQRLSQSKKRKKQRKSIREEPSVKESSKNVHQEKHIDPIFSHTINNFRQSLNKLYMDELTKKKFNLPDDIVTNDPEKLLRVSQLKQATFTNLFNKNETEESDSSIEGIRIVFPAEDSSPLVRAISPLTTRAVSPETTRAVSPLNVQRAITSRPSLGSLNVIKPINQSGVGVDMLSFRKGLTKESPLTRNRSRQGKRKQDIEMSHRALSPNPIPNLSATPSVVFEPRGSPIMKLKTEPNKEMFQLGGKKLEKDIYRFLVKNEDNIDEKATVVGFNQIKKEKLRKIERQASQQYEQFSDRRQSAQSKFPYYPTNLLQVKIAKLERTKTLSLGEAPKKNFALIFQKPESTNGTVSSRPRSVASTPKSGFRSSSFIRRVNVNHIYNEDNSSKQEEGSNRRVHRNDSLFSYTETRLDALYKTSRKVKSTLKKIEQKVTFAASPEDKESLRKKAHSKVRELGEQSEKIKILIRKKIENAYA